MEVSMTTLNTAGRFESTGPVAMMLARYWWIVVLRGVLAILFGIAALLLPGITLAALVIIFAAYMLVDGIFALIAGAGILRPHERSLGLVLEGIANLVAGGIALI